MVDRLIGVGSELAAWEAEALFEVDGGAEGEDACGDASEQAGGGAAAVAFEVQRWIEGVLWVEELSSTTCTSRCAGTEPSIRLRKRRNSSARWRGVICS